MVLFYAYRDGDDTFKQMFQSASNVFPVLTRAFQTLTVSDSNLFSQNLFDMCRDEFRDCLNMHDPTAFPHVGQVGTSVVSILESVLPPETRELELVHLCSNGTCADKSLSSTHVPIYHRFTIPCICSPLYVQSIQCDDLSSNSLSQVTKLNIQQWLDLWCSFANYISFSVVPPILFFECFPLQPVMPCKTISIPHLHGTACYTLVGIIYVGGFHFSARLRFAGKVWNYDGRINNGVPFLEPDVHDFDLCVLPRFENREAHVFLYVLDS
ncbi:hypothetical protein EDC04DRAFT_103848 [Pisolithus marmoratus]|nr:hypothetical protein EDC04DRAFT_103848 [Pisolithus marmoratus]